MSLQRNGMLQHRPDIVEQVLPECDLDAISTDMPVGSHRIRDEWLADRKTLLLEGMPIALDWNRWEEAKVMEDLVEHDYCYLEKMQQNEYAETHGGQDIKIPVIDIDCDEQSLFTDVDAVSALHPRLRRELKTECQGKRSAAEQRARAAQKKGRERSSESMHC